MEIYTNDDIRPGVIAGQGEGPGPVGVAPDAKILSASMWLGPDRPKESGSTREQAAEAIRWSVDNGAKVINMSLGGAGSSTVTLTGLSSGSGPSLSLVMINLLPARIQGRGSR